AAYNLRNKNLMLAQLIKELQSCELMLNGGESAHKAEAKLVVAFSLKGKQKHI
ncbi:hypothetical protein J1N35_037337, partial [Gossypium stocksii]